MHQESGKKIAAQFITAQLSQFLKSDKVMVLPIIALLVSLPILGLSFWQQTRWGRAYTYEVLAKKFAPGSNDARRYRAMAQALRQGKTVYSYASTKGPAAAGK